MTPRGAQRTRRCCRHPSTTTFATAVCFALDIVRTASCFASSATCAKVASDSFVRRPRRRARLAVPRSAPCRAACSTEHCVRWGCLALAHFASHRSSSAACSARVAVGAACFAALDVPHAAKRARSALCSVALARVRGAWRITSRAALAERVRTLSLVGSTLRRGARTTDALCNYFLPRGTGDYPTVALFPRVLPFDDAPARCEPRLDCRGLHLDEGVGAEVQ